MKPRGKLIVFEGIDGSGKNTQIRLFRAGLRRRSRLFSYPDLKGRFGRRIRQFLTGKKRLSPEQQFKLFSADIAKDKGKIQRLVSQGSVVILNRFISSTVAYQSAKGLPFAKAVSLAGKLSLPQPDLAILFDLPAREGLKRKQKQKKASLHEFEKDARFQEKVRSNFKKIARAGLLSRKWVVVGARRPAAEIGAKIKAKIGLSPK